MTARQSIFKIPGKDKRTVVNSPQLSTIVITHDLIFESSKEPNSYQLPLFQSTFFDKWLMSQLHIPASSADLSRTPVDTYHKKFIYHVIDMMNP
jgi:hypothetical protein